MPKKSPRSEASALERIDEEFFLRTSAPPPPKTTFLSAPSWLERLGTRRSRILRETEVPRQCNAAVSSSKLTCERPEPDSSHVYIKRSLVTVLR
mmetsp:Transcript_20339/g.46144  ORF Transcript_20339/g.46144 Transcript_20339/m.46144 type:complete len:94 (+) Transcript_20339:231-512(+)